MKEKLLTQIKELFPMEHHNQVFLVGGAVRDLLQNKTPNDIDLVSTLPVNYFLENGFKYIDPSTSFPVFVRRHETLGKIEIASPRKEEKREGEDRKGFNLILDNVTLEDDLRRRDFTINSIAMTLDGKVIDPLNGRSDLEDKVLRHNSDDAFLEDELRFYRALRFTCKGFKQHESLVDLLESMNLDTLVPERIYTEMMNALKEDKPELFFNSLLYYKNTDNMFGVVRKMDSVTAGPEKYHFGDTTFQHSIDILQKVSVNTKDPIIRLAAILHDVGKILTPKEELPKHHNHDTQGVLLVEDLLKSLKAPNHVIKIVKTVAKLHMKFSRFKEMKPSKKLAFVKEVIDNGAKEALFEVCRADWDANQSVEVLHQMEVTEEVLNMNVAKLGLSLTNFEGRLGPVIGHMILDRRVSMLKSRLKT